MRVKIGGAENARNVRMSILPSLVRRTGARQFDETIGNQEDD